MAHKRCASLITSDRPPASCDVIHNTIHTCGRPHKKLTPGSRRVSGSRRPPVGGRASPALAPHPGGTRRPKRSTRARSRPGSSTGWGPSPGGACGRTGARACARGGSRGPWDGRALPCLRSRCSPARAASLRAPRGTGSPVGSASQVGVRGVSGSTVVPAPARVPHRRASSWSQDHFRIPAAGPAHDARRPRGRGGTR
jgi:hypothetical protein